MSGELEIIATSVTQIEAYKETVGFIAAVSFLGGLGVGFKFGVSSTEKQLEPLKGQIDMMKKLVEQHEISCRESIDRIIEFSKSQNHSREKEIEYLRKETQSFKDDLRVAIKKNCPIKDS